MEQYVETDSNGREHIKIRRVKDDYYEEYFPIANWKDDSAPPSSVDYIKYLSLCRVHTNKSIHFTPQAS